jgi:prepilin-type N-terminal cleavage/methylation domain-containing protein
MGKSERPEFFSCPGEPGIFKVDGMRKHLRKRDGFTLTEIMVVIIVVGLLASIAAPPMFRFAASNRLQTTSDRLAADLQFARQMAVSANTIMQFTSDDAGWSVTNPTTGDVMREREFKHGMSFGADIQANFYPWGMADAKVFNVTNKAGTMVVTLLPTGFVEVN